MSLFTRLLTKEMYLNMAAITAFTTSTASKSPLSAKHNRSIEKKSVIPHVPIPYIFSCTCCETLCI